MACPLVGATFEQVDGGDLGPRLTFPVHEGPWASHESNDQVGLNGVFIGDVPVNQSLEHVIRDVHVDRTAVTQSAARPGTANDDTILGEEILDHAGVHVPEPSFGTLAKLKGQLVQFPAAKDVVQPTNLRRPEPGDRTARGEGQ